MTLRRSFVDRMLWYVTYHSEDPPSQLLTAGGRVRRDPAAVAYVHQLLGTEPLLHDLAEPRPYRSDWGTSALHFTGRWSPVGADVIVKVGLSQGQLWWTRTVGGQQPDLAPTVFASGDRLGLAALRWIVLEELPSGLHDGWGGVEFGLLMDAAVRFQRFGRLHPEGPRRETTVEEVRRWLREGIARGVPGPAHRLVDRLQADWEYVCHVCLVELCHGDLHMANVLSRTPAPLLSPAVLIDFEPCSMPWALEPAYCQVLNSDPDRVGWRRLVQVMAERRLAYGMPVIHGDECDLRRVEAIALGWFAVRSWAMIGPEPDPDWRDPAVWQSTNEAYVYAAATSGSRS